MAARPEVVVRPVRADERAAWEPLWDGYLKFYKAALPRENWDVAWERLHDPAEPMQVLGAYVDGRLTGIVHYLFHRSTWVAEDTAICRICSLLTPRGDWALGER